MTNVSHGPTVPPGRLASLRRPEWKAKPMWASLAI